MIREHAPLLTALVLAGCSLRIDDAIDDRDPGASGPSGTIDRYEACDYTRDGDVGARTYTLTSLRTPTNAVGFNIDERATASARDIAGCGRVDGLPEGVDNAFADFAVTIGQTLAATGIDIPGALDEAVAEGDAHVTLVVHHWNGTADDACVGLELEVDDFGTARPALMASGRLESGRIHYVELPGRLTITPRFYLDELGLGDACDFTECDEYRLPISLAGVRARFAFAGGADGMARLVTATMPDNDDSTILGGYVLYEGSAAEGAFEPAFAEVLGASGFHGSTLAAFPALLDLDTQPSIMPCTSRGNTLSGDAFSIALVATSD